MTFTATINRKHNLTHIIVVTFNYPIRGKRWLSARAESTQPEFSNAENAYEVLGLSETCSFDEIKVSFRKLAKETHPDLVSSDEARSEDVSKRFVEIVAAYEILSDPTKRALYDQYLLTNRHIEQQHTRQNATYQNTYATYYSTTVTTTKQMEVVEWLRWYREAMKEILSQRTLPAGNGYFEVLQREFYSAVHSAYFGPEIMSLDVLPDCFEAEERSVCDTPEVLHLVSGRYLFGIVRIADNGVPELPDVFYEKLSSANADLKFQRGLEFDPKVESQSSWRKPEEVDKKVVDAYKDLELHVCGRLVAVANRVPPQKSPGEIDDECSQDQINVFLNSHEEPMHNNKGSVPVSKILLGKIYGLGTNPDESSCYVYNNSGAKTHVILKHRTPLVKHMHWFQLEDEAAICECRCTRARLPPSKFWLFEPRCGMHDIGGWYVETYGRDMKRKNVPSQRIWDEINTRQQFEKRLHPAVYLLGLAYRSLDMENSRRTKQTIGAIAGGNISRFFSWCKKLM